MGGEGGVFSPPSRSLVRRGVTILRKQYSQVVAAVAAAGGRWTRSTGSRGGCGQVDVHSSNPSWTFSLRLAAVSSRIERPLKMWQWKKGRVVDFSMGMEAKFASAGTRLFLRGGRARQIKAKREREEPRKGGSGGWGSVIPREFRGSRNKRPKWGTEAIQSAFALFTTYYTQFQSLRRTIRVDQYASGAACIGANIGAKNANLSLSLSV